MYKDKQKQKEANRLAAQRRRDIAKGMTPEPDKGMTNQGMTPGYDERVPPGDPLKLYSAERWARAEAKGYRMPVGAYDGQTSLKGDVPLAVELGYARLRATADIYVFLVPVPGDPAYQGVECSGKGVAMCQACSNDGVCDE